MEEIFWKDYFDSLGRAIERLGEAIRHPDVNKNDLYQDCCYSTF